MDFLTERQAKNLEFVKIHHAEQKRVVSQSLRNLRC